jgi:glycine/D-amino acid oxidase-like deaminating enzyme
MVAYRLVQDGVSVVLLDRGEVGKASTAASTGLLLYEVDTPLVDLIPRVGEAHAVRAYRRGLSAIHEIEQLVREVGDRCGFSRRDCLYFASNQDDYAALVREYECRRQHGFEVDLLSRDQLAAVTTLQAAGAIRSRGDAQIDPYRFTIQLVRTAADRGLQVFPNTQVMSIDEDQTDVRVVTPRGTVVARDIVYATGYDSQYLLSLWQGDLNSTYVVASEPGCTGEGWPEGWLLWETARPYLYGRQTDDGRILIGGADTPYADDHQRDELVLRQVEQLLDRFHRLFPKIPFVPELAWAGTFAETKDGLAYIGRPAERPRAYFALGYGGNGITFGVIAARLITDQIAGRPNPDAEVFRFGR